MPEAEVIGGPGSRPGRFQTPRALALDPQRQRLFVADMTDRIQVFDLEGRFLYLWHLPDFNVDGPTGLDVDANGNLVVTDTHLYRILVCSPEGQVRASIGGVMGTGPGEFISLRHVAVRPAGEGYVTTESGGNDRVQVFDSDGVPIAWWGSHGSGPGQFRRPEAVEVTPENEIIVADSCNHRIQVFSLDGELLRMWGEPGRELGQLLYPYDVFLGPDGLLYICEYGNHRLQRFTPEGEPIDLWGGPGRAPGQMAGPWAVVVTSDQTVFVADGSNHRLLRFEL